MNTPLLTLGKSDFVKGAVTAVFAAVLTVLYGVVSQAGFDVFEADWGAILGQMVQVSMTAFVAYLSKNFISDEDGNVMGMQ